MNLNGYIIGTSAAFLVLLLVWLLGISFAIALPLLAVTVGVVVALTHYSSEVPDVVALFGGGLAVLFLLLPAPGWISFWGMLFGVSLILSALIGSNGGGLRNTVAGGLHVVGGLVLFGSVILIVAQAYPEKTNELLGKASIEYRFDTGREPETDRAKNKPSSQRQHTHTVADLNKSSWKIVTPNDPDGSPLSVRIVDDRANLSYEWSSNGEVGQTIIQVRQTKNFLRGKFETSQAGNIDSTYGTVELKKRFEGCFTGTMKTDTGQRADIAVRREGILCRP